MAIQLTQEEQKLVNYAKEAVVRYNKQRLLKGGIDTIYAFVLSDSGKIYDGACLESAISTGNICAERLAIGNMVLKESYKSKVKSVVVADPVPEVLKNSTTPCGTCRHVIWELGTPDTTIICVQYMKQKDGWVFPKMQKYTIKELYPEPYKLVKWN